MEVYQHKSSLNKIAMRSRLSVAERKVSNQARHLVTYAKKFFGGHRQLCEAADISVRSIKSLGEKKKAKSVKKAVQQLDMQKQLLNTFVSISEAARKTDVKNSNISGCCNGKQDRAGGFIWRFV